jgi:hypothetical protein
MAGFSLAPRRASTVALVALVSTQLGQTLIVSRSSLVMATAAGSLVSLGALISTPGGSQLLGCTPLGPIGWAQALGTAGVATAAAAVEIIDWPVALILVAGHVLMQNEHSRIAQEVGEALDDA